jgi:hypothetical protein
MRHRRPSVMLVTVVLAIAIFNLEALLLSFADIQLGCPVYAIVAVTKCLTLITILV